METESVKISTSVVKKVRGHKAKTGIPVGKFFEMAATERLSEVKGYVPANGLVTTSVDLGESTMFTIQIQNSSNVAKKIRHGHRLDFLFKQSI